MGGGWRDWLKRCPAGCWGGAFHKAYRSCLDVYAGTRNSTAGQQQEHGDDQDDALATLWHFANHPGL